MRFRRRLGFIAGVSFIGALVAIHRTEDPDKPASAFDATPQRQAVGPAQRDQSSVAVRIAENAINKEILRDRVETADDLTNTVSDDQTTPEPFARLEPNDVPPDQGVEPRNRFAENLERRFAGESRDPGSSSQMEYRILDEAYGGACAFCGLTFAEALDAAHILPWSKCGSADRVSPLNGLLLCSNHHEMFDAGWLRINDSYEIAYFDMRRENKPLSPMDEALGFNLHGQKMRLPKEEGLRPDPAKIRARYATAI